MMNSFSLIEVMDYETDKLDGMLCSLSPFFFIAPLHHSTPGLYFPGQVIEEQRKVKRYICQASNATLPYIHILPPRRPQYPPQNLPHIPLIPVRLIKMP
jgi:hypothetical protein